MQGAADEALARALAHASVGMDFDFDLEDVTRRELLESQPFYS